MIESPQQHEPNQQMTSTTYIDSVPELTIPEQTIPEQPVPKQTINNQSSTTNIFAEPTTSINDQPSSSNLSEAKLEPKLLLLEYKTATEAKLEEARIREEKLIRSDEEFKQKMKEQAKETNRIMQEMMEMFQKQAQP